MAATIQTIQKPTRARALDTSGNNNHGQIYSGRALEFDGVSDNFIHNGGVVLNGVNQFNNEVAWTFATWINFDNVATFTMFVGDENATHSNIGMHNSHLFFRQHGVSNYFRPTDTTLESNTWYRLVVVASTSKTITFYLNGVQFGSPITTSTLDYPGSSVLFTTTNNEFTGWGAPYFSTTRQHHFAGKMSDGQVWDAAWTADDALFDYLNPEQLVLNRGGTSLTNSNLKIWYPMNDGHRGQQSYILDASDVTPPNKNHATTVFYGDGFADLLSSDQITALADALDGTNLKFNFSTGTTNLIASDGFTASNATFVNASGKGKLSNSASAQGLVTLPLATVAGRTYDVKFDVSSISGANVNVSLGSSAAYNSSNAAANIGASTNNALATAYVADDTTSFLAIQLTTSTSGHFVNLDSFHVWEVGTASGWTDADQQLDIPQTALQSYNQLAWFSGINDSDLTHVQLSGDITKNVHNSNVSYSTWVKRNVTNAQHIIFGDDGTSVQKLIRLEVNGTISIESNNNDNTVIATLAANDTDWHHYVVTCASGTTKFYQDGELLTNTNANVMDDALTIRRLGGGTAKGLEGSMTEASIWDAALTQAEVNELYNDGKALDALTHSNSNLFGYWRDNGLSTWEDLKGSIDGTPTNFAETMLITAGVDGSRDSQGFLMNRQRTTNSLNLYDDDTQGDEAIGAQVKLLQNPLTEAEQNAMTVTCWFKTPDNTQTDALLNIVADNAAMFIVQTNGTGRFRWTYEVDGFSGEARYKTVSGLFSSDKWTFVAFALDTDIGSDTTRVKCYVGDEDNAVSLRAIDSDQNGTATSGMDDNSMWIGGGKVSGKKFTGELDDVCVYSKTLELPEITRNYNAGKRSHR